MLPTPVKYTLVAASAEGPTKLNAFDNALLAAGIGNLNLIKVSSILPPGAEFVEKLEIPPGSLTPTAYGHISSESPGEYIAAAVAVGLSRDSFGVIMEFSGHCREKEARERVTRMAEEALHLRGMPIDRILVRSTECQVVKCACAFAAVALWY
ncbi:MAG: pyruvoyl-dependent arginine decarboxylase [Bacillota bacterium]